MFEQVREFLSLPQQCVVDIVVRRMTVEMRMCLWNGDDENLFQLLLLLISVHHKMNLQLSDVMRSLS